MPLLSEYDYELPDELIARYPAERREGARLLVVRGTGDGVRGTGYGEFEDRKFTDLPEYLRDGDVLVLNETKVIPARLDGTRESTGAKVEIFLLHRQADRTDTWHVLAAPAKKVKTGETIRINEELSCEVVDELAEGERIVRFVSSGDLEAAIERAGSMPIPPYLKRESDATDRERYQTIFARVPGAVAAPTASLHFTDELLREIEAKGVRIARVVLHVGLGTFRPVEVEDVTQHRMHAEYYEVTEAAAKIINDARAGGGRIVAAGTTAARTLETVADANGIVHASSGETSIFIYPPYTFKAVDALVTNFHQPKSTLLMMVSAFATPEIIREAYTHAIRERYRFLSYGDAMLIQ